MALSIFWGCMTVGRLGTSLFAIKFNPRILYQLSPFLIIASLFLITASHSERHMPFYYVGVGLGCSPFFPLSMSLSVSYYEASREKLLSLMMAALMIGVGIGSSAIGLFREQRVIDLSQAFLLAAFSALIMGGMAIFLTCKEKRPS